MPMTYGDLLGIAYREYCAMTYLVLWPNVSVNRGVCGKSLGRFNTVKR
jgi:hypothetical protein